MPQILSQVNALFSAIQIPEKIALILAALSFLISVGLLISRYLGLLLVAQIALMLAIGVVYSQLTPVGSSLWPIVTLYIILLFVLNAVAWAINDDR